MTRLNSQLISGMNETITAYDLELVQKTGLTLKQIAARTAGMSEDALCLAFERERVATIPVTSGQGVIEGFTQAVQVIIHHLGCPSFVTESRDVAGLAEGIEKGATILFLADDIRFIAINLTHKCVIDNAFATGWSFAHALDACAAGIRGREVLLIGGGRVGTHALCALEKLGSKVGVFDIDSRKVQSLADRFNIRQEVSLPDALARYTLLFDASPAPDIIRPEHIKPETIIAACGVPLGVSAEARPLVEDRLVHDPLQLGTASMLAMAVRHGLNDNGLNDKYGGRIGRIA